jgi:RNA polymerase sigma-70 factor (subfamily 1)
VNSLTTLEQYREYLGLSGQMQVDQQLAGKVDVSGVVQTTMLEAIQQTTTWETRQEEARLAWLRRIFANNLLDEIRRFRAQSRDVAREVSLDQALEQSASRLDVWLAKQQSSPSQRAVRSEQAVRLAAALHFLTPPQREAIELHHLRGMRLDEVDKRMKRDKGAVAALILRGTKRLRELLGNQRSEFDD